MTIKLSLQNLAEWVKDSSDAAKGAVELTLESGLLKDSLDDLCELGGVTGALFKLGARAIPDPTPEQRIAARLHKTFLKAFDQEIKRRPDLITESAWRSYLKERLPQVATEKLSAQFTWLSIFGSRGRKPGRSWPIVGDLADLGRTWFAEMAAKTDVPPVEIQRAADDARGRIHEALTREVDELVVDPVIVQALNEAQPRTTREGLDLLAQELTTLRRYRLFGEIPQDTVYIPARIKTADLREKKEKAEVQWDQRLAAQGADRILFKTLRTGHPRLLVIEGPMGVGKSCLMRILASQMAEQYLSDRRHAPIYVRWRDIFSEPDLARAIAGEMAGEHGVPLHDLPDQPDIVYLVDGFDEMSSHQESYVTECFNRLAKLVQRGCSVVVAMRSTVITPGLRLAWKNGEALVAQIQDFTEDDVDAWTLKWCEETGVEGVTGAGLRSLGSAGVADNPLLLYMLARYVEPVARGHAQLRRTQVFRIFVEETIRGKLRTSQEAFPFSFPEQDYRFLLQELAYLASWPKHAPKCPTRLVREKISDSFLKDLNFQDIRTAFVLHFFEPGDLSGNEFEFQPEGFRQYLLAEWCVRAQWDALRDEKRPDHPLARTREKALDALAQFPLREEERFLLNEIYEELGSAAESIENKLFLASGMTASNPQNEIHRLFGRVRDEAQEPPMRSWDDEKVGIPVGQEMPPGLNQLRFLFNYWDQCMVATLGLYRGLRKNSSSEPVFDRDPHALGRFIRAWHVVRGFTDFTMEINLSDLHLAHAKLQNVTLKQVNLAGSNLAKADMPGATLSGAYLVRANLTDANLDGAYLCAANLQGACLDRANLNGAVARGAILDGATLVGANLGNSDLVGASFVRANLRETQMSRANLTDADLEEAAVNDVDFSESILRPQEPQEVSDEIKKRTKARKRIKKRPIG